MVAAVLAILAAMATGFYTLMLMQTKSAMRYTDTVRADMLARAGIDFAVANLRDQAFKKTEDPTDPWYMYNYLDGAKRRISYPDSYLLHNNADDDGDGDIDNAEEAFKEPDKLRGYSVAMTNSANNPLTTPADPNNNEGGTDRFNLNILDAASRININAGENLAVILDNLCRLIGPPLVAADQKALIPRVWEWYGGDSYNKDALDWPKVGTPGSGYSEVSRNIYFWLYDSTVSTYPVMWDGITKLGAGRPRINLPPGGDGRAVYGDGYAIAGWRARNGRFRSLEDVKQALTFVDRNGNDEADDPLEVLEIEVKYQALRDYITIDSWVDTNSVCVGKFEWVYQKGGSGDDPYDIAIDRDKCWVIDDPVNDPENRRGSLRGCYVSIINGHGAGQLRRIRTNGIDWIQLDRFKDPNSATPQNFIGFTVPPGPTSSYMIIAPENAKLVDKDGKDVNFTYPDTYPAKSLEGLLTFPKTDASGNLVPALNPDGSPKADFVKRPLCFHRSPVNVNTASDKVLGALFMGINVTHGNYLSVGTDADITKLAPMRSRYAWQSTDPDWKIKDYDDRNQVYRIVEPYILTPKGLKRIPADPGYLVLGRPKPWAVLDDSKFSYIINNGVLGAPTFVVGKDAKGTAFVANDAHELAYRIIVARQTDPTQLNLKWIDPKTGQPTTTANDSYKRGPFRSWDDFYFRVIRPWDEQRIDPLSPSYNPKAGSVARLIMAHFNPNSDILKFNPNIEWIDRWGRNFTEMEPVMLYTNQAETSDGISLLGHGTITGPGTITVCDQDAAGLTATSVPVFSRERVPWGGSKFVSGVFGTPGKWQGSYVVRSFRYKADEVIDKTDVNRSTTEFCFDSKGIYEIQSTGQVVKRGDVLAERKVMALVKVYDVWTETTQREFVQGYMSRAKGDPGTTQAGQIARDATNVNSRLALTTLPEPVVPLQYTIDNPNSRELVDEASWSPSKKRDAWGNPVDMNVPLIVANHVLAAGYDGQIVLATNTLRFDKSSYATDPTGDCDTFLASFNGDLDTETCLGNGHELAKSPLDCKVQVMDRIGLLGALNDTQIDNDPGLANPAGSAGALAKPDLAYTDKPLDLFPYQSIRAALRGLKVSYYWNNVSCRQGDLRADGCYVGGPGIAGNDGVFRYECGSDSSIPPGSPILAPVYDRQNMNLNGKGAIRAVGEDYGNRGTAGAVEGWLISTWTKTTWHHNDNRGHEFFNATQPGWNDAGIRAEAFWWRKHGGPQYAAMEDGSYNPAEDGTWGTSGCGNRINDFGIFGEHIQDGGDWSEPDYNTCLHGGMSGVYPTRMDSKDAAYRPESPSYYIQPFRWHFIGARLFVKQDFASCTNSATFSGATGKSGYLKRGGWAANDTVWVSQNLMRPFVDTERWNDGPNYDFKGKYWCSQQVQGSSGFKAYQDKGRAGPMAGRADGGQPVRWSWASPGGETALDGDKTYNHPIFGVNNCNPGRGYPGSGDFPSIYRGSVEEGTYAVIDEYKISRKETVLRNPPDWDNDRITRNNQNKPGEMTLSRYYLPDEPANRKQCPTFISQTMLQSMKGHDKKTTTTPEYVTLARVSWNCFAPRFLHEYKTADPLRFIRRQTITKTDGWWGGGVMVQNPEKLDVPFRGPFNYCVYNDLAPSNDVGSKIDSRSLKAEEYEDFNDPAYDDDVAIMPYRCNRPTPAQYQLVKPYNVAKNYHATKGVEIEILDASESDAMSGTGKVLGTTGVYKDPDAINKIMGPSSAAYPKGTQVRVSTDRLRYRVTFRYPVDKLADPNAPFDTVDPATQFLLDTPVFDDISITYFTRPRILDYKDVTE